MSTNSPPSDADYSTIRNEEKDELVRMAMTGDLFALAVLCIMQFPLWFSTSQKYVRVQDTDDVISNTVVRVFTKFSLLFEPKDAPYRRFRAWSAMIAEHEAAAIARRNGKHRERTEESFDINQSATECELMDHVDRHDEIAPVIDALHGALQELSDNQLLVLTEHYFNGRSLIAIADSTGLPSGTVRSLHHRGIKALKRKLGV